MIKKICKADKKICNQDFFDKTKLMKGNRNIQWIIELLANHTRHYSLERKSVLNPQIITGMHIRINLADIIKEHGLSNSQILAYTIANIEQNNIKI